MKKVPCLPNELGAVRCDCLQTSSNPDCPDCQGAGYWTLMTDRKIKQLRVAAKRLEDDGYWD